MSPEEEQFEEIVPEWPEETLEEKPKIPGKVNPKSEEENDEIAINPSLWC